MDILAIEDTTQCKIDVNGYNSVFMYMLSTEDNTINVTTVLTAEYQGFMAILCIYS